MAWNILDDSWTGLSGIPSDFQDGKINWSEIQNKPATFTPSEHTHSQYAEKSFSNTFSKSQSIDVGVNSGLLAGISILSGGSADNRGYFLGVTTGGSFYISQVPDTTGAAKILLSYTRNGGLILGWNGSSRLATTENGIALPNLSATSAGLGVGSLWRDSNGFLRIV